MQENTWAWANQVENTLHSAHDLSEQLTVFLLVMWVELIGFALVFVNESYISDLHALLVYACIVT